MKSPECRSSLFDKNTVDGRQNTNVTEVQIFGSLCFKIIVPMLLFDFMSLGLSTAVIACIC